MVEIPKRVKRDLKFIFVDRMEEVLPVALLPEAGSEVKLKTSTPQSS
jgi:ATP-dependent Lon protease